MKHSERFNRAVSALVQAFFNGTLIKGNCRACAVGNIVAVSMEVELYRSEAGGILCDIERIEDWSEVFSTSAGIQETRPFEYKGYPKKLIDSTGYSWQELARIEYAFENNTKAFGAFRYSLNAKTINDQYNGLMAVVDVLCDIEGIDTTETKKLFELSI